MNTCVGEPISWLRLERYRLDELAGAERSEIERHLHACAVCSQCLAQVDAPIALPPLPLAVEQPRVKARARRSARWPWAVGAGAVLAAAAALMLVLRSAAPGLEPQPRAIAIKGGELAMGLVRERAGSVANDPSRFAPGDRFKVLLTCPPSMQPYVDVAVFQGGQTFFPLPSARIDHCGNQVMLPGAFTLDGTADTWVCTIAADAPVPRSALSRKGRVALPARSVCELLVAAR